MAVGTAPKKDGPMVLWNSIKDRVRDGVTAAAGKTEELTRVGRIRLEIASIRRQINKHHSNLGQYVHSLITSGGLEIASDDEVRGHIEQINLLTIELKAQELRLAEVQGEYGAAKDKDSDGDDD